MPRTRVRYRRSAWLGFVLALPALVFAFLFLFWPIVVAGQYSFTSASGYGDKTPVGLDNYARALGDQRFFDALGRNVVFAVMVMVAAIAIGFVLAYFLFLGVRGWRALQVMFLIPFIMPVVVVGLLWQFMLEPTNGLVNSGLRMIGLDALAGPWLTGEQTALPSVALVHVWTLAPFAMLLIFSAMLALPTDVLEAASLDGAGHVKKMIHVVLPMVRPTVIMVAFVLTLQLFRSFDLVYLLTKGGPVGSTTIATLYVFIQGFTNNQYGYANALGVILGVVLGAVALVPRLVQRRAARIARLATAEGDVE